MRSAECGITPHSALRTLHSALLTLSSVSVLEADDVVRLGCRHLEYVRILDRGHAVHRRRCDVDRVARPHFGADQLAVDFPLEQHLAGPHEDRLVLLVVVLQAQRMALVDVDLLADVAIGARPPHFVAPGLLDAV